MTAFLSVLALCAATSTVLPAVAAFGIREPSVPALLQQHASQISELKGIAKSVVQNDEVLSKPPYSNDVFYLRYCLLPTEAEERFRQSLDWRRSPRGTAICEAASSAYLKAVSGGDGRQWNNDPVRELAPHAAKVNEFITPSTCLTTSSSRGDLLYCVRAGKIDVTQLMEKVSVDELKEFFLYCKEVNCIVANERSTEELKYVVVVNDLKGVKLIGGETGFRDALSAASKEGNNIYSSTLNGPTLLLNLPALLSALVKLFTPLFPKEVSARIKFERGPLKDVEDLTDIGYGGKSRGAFMNEVDRLCYNK